MKGKLYGIGVGPGDSELMTVKAARIVGEADVIITPKTEKKDGSVALNIAKPYIQEHTEIVPVVFPMVLDDATQQEGWEEAKRVIVSYLEQGKNVVFLTLGDPMFYSTYMYVYRLIENTGFEIETISWYHCLLCHWFPSWLSNRRKRRGFGYRSSHCT